MPQSADFVMYLVAARRGSCAHRQGRRFGLITTNSLRQIFNRRVVAPHLDAKHPLLVFAIPDHPWVERRRGGGAHRHDSWEAGTQEGRLLQVSKEIDAKSEEGRKD